MLGLGPKALQVDWAASVVVACVNTQRRDAMVKRVRVGYPWQFAANEVDPESELRVEINTERPLAFEALDGAVRRSFQHYAFLVRDAGRTQAHFAKFDDDGKSALNGNDVWAELVSTRRCTAGPRRRGFLSSPTA